jgi:hypothetical protein
MIDLSRMMITDLEGEFYVNAYKAYRKRLHDQYVV